MKDVQCYKDFVPWCVNSTVLSTESQILSDAVDSDTEVFFADLTCGFMKITETYTSRICCKKHRRIEAEAIQSDLFKHLRSFWSFEKLEDGCNVEFHVDFEFKSYMYGYVANLFFLEVSKGMISAFESRCKKLLQSSSST